MICHILYTLKTCVEAALSSPTLNPIFGLIIPNHTCPARITSMPIDIPENILVFRTITTLLANIPRTVPSIPTDNLQDPKWQNEQTRQQLKISDAFAQLAVSQHDVVAVSTALGWPILDLVTCTGQDTPQNEADQNAPQSEAKSLLDKAVEMARKPWLFLIARNNRTKDPATSSGDHPAIISAKKPEDLNSRTAYEYMENLVAHWIQPSLPTHLWILTNVLMEGAQKHDSAEFRTELIALLFKYTAAMSCRKIYRRISNEEVSQAYIKSLKEVAVEDIPKLSLSNSRGLTGDPKRHKEEISNDRLLLSFIKSSGEESNVLATKTPKLLALARLTPLTFPIYNDETSHEFHLLLLELLDSFESAVIEICHLLGLRQEPDNYSSQFVEALDDARVYGYGLLKLARGQAFRMHIENVGPLLKKPYRNNRNDTEALALNAEDLVAEPKEPEDEDEELTALQPVLLPNGDSEASRKTLTKSYVDWLRLTVAHFDAVEIVFRYVTSPKFHHEYIDVKNVVSPSTSKALYPWQELLKNPKYFPTTDPTSESMTSNTATSNTATSNTQILQFLEAAVSEAVQAKALSTFANAALKEWKNHNSTAFKVQFICQKIADIIRTGNATIKGIAEPVFVELKLWPKGNIASITQGINRLNTQLSYLPPGNSFFSGLEKLEFKGALHCEACLASLINNAAKLDLLDSEYTELLRKPEPYGRIIGVSKRCCPICLVFLDQLTKDGGGDPFIVRGSHSVISSCTLPPWTPSPVVDSMVKTFGTILREDLVTLMKNMATPCGFNRNRSNSTGSDTLSIDSFESCEDDPQDVVTSFRTKTPRRLRIGLIHSVASSS